jgi:hypothetical protein
MKSEKYTLKRSLYMKRGKSRFYCHAFSERILRHHALRGLMKPKASRGIFTLYMYHLPPSLDGG